MVRDRIGLIVNPIAGMGGAVGLKGTDGERVSTAASLGAQPVSPARALVALQQMAALRDDLEIFTAGAAMGAAVAAQAGFTHTVVADAAGERTTAEDTALAATAIAEREPSLLLFAGGDGTARDVFGVIGDRVPLLGIPAGVKMHSAIFAATPRAAGEVARRYLRTQDRESTLQPAEIIDREPSTSAGGAADLHLYGIARVPRLSFLVPGAKAASPTSDYAALSAALQRTVDSVCDDRVTLIGPGATMLDLKHRLGIAGTALGVDAVRNGECVGVDLDERRILALIEGQPARIVVTVIGGQGYLFGRGNQQFGPGVIRQVGCENIVVVSSLEKLAALPTQTLLVDTGDDAVDLELAGHREVIVGGARTVMMPVSVFVDDATTI